MSEKIILKNLITEEELMELFGISKNVLYGLRTKYRLPYYHISKGSRIYSETDIMSWLNERKRVLN